MGYYGMGCGGVRTVFSSKCYRTRLTLANHKPFKMASSSPLLPLAFAKNVKRSCELCGQAAHIECNDCKVTFWW